MSGVGWRRNRAALAIRSLYLLFMAAALPPLVWNQWVGQVNSSLGDVLLWTRGAVRSRTVGDIALAAIDDTTAARYGPLPLRRSLLADGIRRLASFGPRAVAVDLLLSEPGPTREDAALAEAFRRAPNVVLGAALGSDPAASDTWIMPLPEFAASHLLGHVHVEPDADGVVRSIPLEETGGGRRLWALGLQAARAGMRVETPLETPDALQLGSIRIPASARSRRTLIINYAGPEGTFHRVSFSALLDGTAHAEDFRGKIVFLGVTAQGGGDRIFTPVSSRIGMSGIEIHANVARTILDADFLQPLSAAAEFVLLLLVCAACVFGIGFLRGVRLHAALTLVAVAIVACCAAALRSGYILPLGTLMAGFILSGAVAGLGEYTLTSVALREAERRQRDYAFRVQAIAHEIKTPLTAIQGSSELMSGEDVPEEQRAQIAGMIHKESKRLTQIIHTFLDVERMAAGALTLDRQPVDLASLCDEVLERARLYASRKRIAIDADVPRLTIAADRDLLSFAIYNLLTNAVKYSPKRTTIRLTVEQRSGVRISVLDQGYGIAPVEQGKIFERFYRVKRNQQHTEEGAGIGLALVKEIATLHGGSIELESREGAGSRFTIVLPLASS